MESGKEGQHITKGNIHQDTHGATSICKITGTLRNADNKETKSLGKSQEPNQVNKGKEKEKEQAKLKSALKNTFQDVAARAANLPEPAPIIPKWEAHRFACMFDIKMPKDRSYLRKYRYSVSV